MDIFWAFLLTLIAGLSTGIGGLIASFSKTSNTKFLSVSLGFSAGVMIYVSMIEIFLRRGTRFPYPLGKRWELLLLSRAFSGVCC